jgi:outer membrane protein assembly factor BamB
MTCLPTHRPAGYLVAVAAVICWSATSTRTADAPAGKYWPQWRGPEANGVSRSASPPLQWSESKNVSWKIELPGRGSATPVIWGDRLFILSAVPVGVATDQTHAALGGVKPRVPHRYLVLAIDRHTGKTLW